MSERGEGTVGDASGGRDDLVPEADRQEQAVDASGGAEPGLTAALRTAMSSDDEVADADRQEQVLDRTGAVEPGLAVGLRSALAGDDEVSEADALDQATSIADEDEDEPR